MRLAALLAACVFIAGLLGGCATGRPLDPNDPQDGPLSAQIINKQMKALNQSLYTRRIKGELTEDEYLRLLSQGADEIIYNVKLDAMDPSEIWLYAEVLRTAKRWKEAEEVLKVAVKHAKMVHDEDRRVNDTLRLAQAEANLGKVKEAIATAKTTFDVRPEDAVPVMMGTLYEIIPAARGKGQDVELAKLLEQAIAVHMRAKVDPASDAGRAFIQTRPNHVRKAWETVASLYQDAGRNDLALEAFERQGDGKRNFTSTTRV